MKNKKGKSKRVIKATPQDSNVDATIPLRPPDPNISTVRSVDDESNVEVENTLNVERAGSDRVSNQELHSPGPTPNSDGFEVIEPPREPNPEPRNSRHSILDSPTALPTSRPELGNVPIQSTPQISPAILRDRVPSDRYPSRDTIMPARYLNIQPMPPRPSPQQSPVMASASLPTLFTNAIIEWETHYGRD